MEILKLLGVFLFIISCSTEKPIIIEGKEIDGIYYEEAVVNGTRGNPYNLNNKIYTSGSQIRYDYCLIKKGDSCKFVWPQRIVDTLGIPKTIVAPIDSSGLIEGFEFHLSDSKIGNGRDSIEPIGLLEMNFIFADTLMRFNQIIAIVENDRNVWISNAWGYSFSFLNLLPEPLIKAPFVIGNSWERTEGMELTCRANFYDFNLFEGNYRSKIKYEIVDLQKIETSYGLLDCYVIEAVSITHAGKTSLKAFFNQKMGFVNLKYKFDNGVRLDFFRVPSIENGD